MGSERLNYTRVRFPVIPKWGFSVQNDKHVDEIFFPMVSLLETNLSNTIPSSLIHSSGEIHSARLTADHPSGAAFVLLSLCLRAPELMPTHHHQYWLISLPVWVIWSNSILTARGGDAQLGSATSQSWWHKEGLGRFPGRVFECNLCVFSSIRVFQR